MTKTTDQYRPERLVKAGLRSATDNLEGCELKPAAIASAVVQIFGDELRAELERRRRGEVSQEPTQADIKKRRYLGLKPGQRKRSHAYPEGERWG